MGIELMINKLEKTLGLTTKINWINSIWFIFIHVYGSYWCWHYAFPVKVLTVALAMTMYIISGMGITCGVHRLFAHKSYKVNTPLKIFLILCFYSTGQNNIYQWVRDHRLHHKFSDTDADPHDARRGLFFSHIGWLMTTKNDEVKKQGKKIDMSDIESDKLIMFHEKYSVILKLVFCFILPTMLNVYLLDEEFKCAVAWQCIIKYLVLIHSEMTVNSLAHAYGYTPYNKNIRPKENKFVATVTFGEGWHNYHHVFPYDYKSAEYFDALNWSTAFIRWWAKMGWAYDLKEASPDIISSVIKRVGEEASDNVENDLK